MFGSYFGLTYWSRHYPEVSWAPGPSSAAPLIWDKEWLAGQHRLCLCCSAIGSSLFTPNLRNFPVVVVLLLLLEMGICIVSILTKIFRGKFHTRNTLNFLLNSSSSDHVKGDRLDAFAGPQGHHPPAVSEAIHLHCLFGASKGHYENVILLHFMANKP